jgi:transmembrane sensor
MRSKIEIEKIIDDFFYNRIPAGHAEEAIKLMAGTSGEIDTDHLMRVHWEEEKSQEVPDEKEFEVFLDNIHHRINLIEENKLRTRAGKRKQKMHLGKILNTVSKLAAVLFIPLLIWTLIDFSERDKRKESFANMNLREVYTPMAAKTKFFLPDGTVVWLNSGSKLVYPDIFAGNTREVVLSGEGYFDVMENPEKPFVVKTDKINVTAYGTAFNVMAYPDDTEIEATLVSGSVKVEDKCTGYKYRLQPSYQFAMDSNKSNLSVSKVDTRFFTSWKDGKLIFKNEPFEMVARKLERWYNCTIYLSNPDLKDIRYTGNIEMETLRELLELISITTPIKSTYKQDTREIWLEAK